MANILDKIIADKRGEVEIARQTVPIDDLISRAENMPRCRNFYKAITKPGSRGVNVIAEVKKASPSAGLIRPDFDPVDIAMTYQECGADAISVLTDEKYFQGKLEYLSRVKAAVDIPVLRKDFFIDEYQIYEARCAGADAILLIAEALSPARLIDLLILASQLSLTTLIEVHSLDLLLGIKDLLPSSLTGYYLLGVNNRDLTTMTVDINNFSRMAEFVDDKRSLVAESGIKTRSDVEKIIRTGAGGVLIGETLCRSESIEEKYRELFAKR